MVSHPALSNPAYVPRESNRFTRREGGLVREIYKGRWFNNGQDPTVDPSLSEVLREIGQNPEVIVPRAASAEIKAELASETNAARALGIFGSPTFTVGSEIFWGDDRFEDAIQWYRQSDQKSAV
jgi:2-hydroxychromene-2-carboxylate isomerase